MSKPETKQEFSAPTDTTTLEELYINFRVKTNQAEYELALRHDQSCIDTINRSNKKYVVISSSNSPLEKALIMSIQAEYLKQSNNYYIINHHGAHWDTSSIEGGNLKTNINSSGTDLACGCYTILQIIADDPNIIDKTQCTGSKTLDLKA